MKKIIIISIAVVAVVATIALIRTGSNSVAGECQEICAHSLEVCPSIQNTNQCESHCKTWSDDIKNSVKEAGDCVQLTNIPEFMLSLIPEITEPDPVQGSGSDCEKACNNYNSKCLTMVPNATQALFDERFASCMGECEAWNSSKIDCMATAGDCESMTNVCGL